MKTMVMFLLAATLFLLVLSCNGAQEPTPDLHVGILIPEKTRTESNVIKGLKKGLEELGYREKKNILISVLNAEGNRGALESMARKFASRKVNLIVTTGTRATKVAQASASEIPIVFIHPANPEVLGLVKSMTRPGGNVTGVAALSLQMTGKRLEIIKEIVPKLRQVLIFYDANNGYSRKNFAVAQKAAEKLGLEVADHPIKSADELMNTIGSIQKSQGKALFHIPDDLVESRIDSIFETARKKRLPTMSYEELWVTKGGLASYGPSYFQMGRQAAGIVDKILKGQRPQDLPVERANKFDLTINFRAASIMGFTIPPEVLKKADLVIR